MKNSHCLFTRIANILWILIVFASSIAVPQTKENKVEVTKGISVSVPVGRYADSILDFEAPKERASLISGRLHSKNQGVVYD